MIYVHLLVIKLCQVLYHGNSRPLYSKFEEFSLNALPGLVVKWPLHPFQKKKTANQKRPAKPPADLVGTAQHLPS